MKNTTSTPASIALASLERITPNAVGNGTFDAQAAWWHLIGALQEKMRGVDRFELMLTPQDIVASVQRATDYGIVQGRKL